MYVARIKFLIEDAETESMYQLASPHLQMFEDLCLNSIYPMLSKYKEPVISDLSRVTSNNSCKL